MDIIMKGILELQEDLERPSLVNFSYIFLISMANFQSQIIQTENSVSAIETA